MNDWVVRFIKGIFIGSGFILPGVSGGALAAVFGIYERLISFFAHITRGFKQNVIFFLPVGLGWLTGVFLFSFAVSFLLETYETQIIWFFIGCILGTMPALWRQAGKKARQIRHFTILSLSFIGGLLFMLYGEKLFGGNVTENFATWTLAGALIGLGVVVPGLSPSNFLIYMGMYKDMSDGIKNLDFMIMIPIALGVILTVLMLSKLMDFLFKKVYSGLFHGIFGIVLASTVMIVPRDFNYLTLRTFVCVILCGMGVLLGHFMCSLEEKYKH